MNNTVYEAVVEYEGAMGYPNEKRIVRKTLKGFENALQKLIDERGNVVPLYVTPNLEDNELVNSLPTSLF